MDGSWWAGRNRSHAPWEVEKNGERWIAERHSGWQWNGGWQVSRQIGAHAITITAMRRVNCELTFFLLLLLWQGYCDFSLIHPVHDDNDDGRELNLSLQCWWLQIQIVLRLWFSVICAVWVDFWGVSGLLGFNWTGWMGDECTYFSKVTVIKLKFDRGEFHGSLDWGFEFIWVGGFA